MEPIAAAATAAAITRPIGLVFDGHIGASILGQIEDMADIRPVERAGGEPRQLRTDLGISHQEEVDVVARQAVVERRAYDIARPQRVNKMRRDYDNQIGLLFLVLA